MMPNISLEIPNEKELFEKLCQCIEKRDHEVFREILYIYILHLGARSMNEIVEKINSLYIKK